MKLYSEWFLFIAIIHSTIFYIFNSILKNNLIPKYKGIQRLHDGETPRIGGLLFFIPFAIIIIFYKKYFELNLIPIIIANLIIIFFLTIEDIRYSLTIYSRLLVTFFASIFFLYFVDLPEIKIELIKPMADISIIKYILFTLSLILIINGFNFIDGLNGLSSFNFFCILLSNYYLANTYQDLILIKYINLIFFISLFNFVYNFPFGKIFLGDGGSYTYAFISGTLVIILFQRNPEIPTLLALLILAYPITEVIFSIMRKVIAKKSPMSPDLLHFHHLIFKLLPSGKNISNNLASLLMLPICITPFLMILISLKFNFLNNFHLYLIFLTIYSAFYWILLLLSKKKIN